ncbi:MarR family transcriptional regulator [Sphingobacterium sp. DR205]|uniref:MarR family winged helix-turn-helix transcriptional regulator n=1 Tax=Sphingobacterium sp. DR205 TaxID=2713573 RepID=UPI0013E454DA|nr:MarR family transcriptional regulator [Sphingobacterium sp. DR205]QIH32642.1 winged helix DNA-binding protein [Sphingobacterium sp. DR205]
MKYQLLKEVLVLIEKFEEENSTINMYSNQVEGFKEWIAQQAVQPVVEPTWEGKEKGRSPESVISTLIVHMNRFAKNYSKAAIWGSDFSTQEEFIYLITLKSFGEMTKMELIKRNIHEKPVGIAIVNRLIKQGWIAQKDSQQDRRSKLINITEKGLQVLEGQMQNIRHATQIVSGDLNHLEKMELIRLLNKLSDFHQAIYEKNIAPDRLLDELK